LVFFFFIGLVTNILALKLISLFPVLYFLFVYYINRKEFIQLQAV